MQHGRCSQVPLLDVEPIELDDTVTDELLESADTVSAQYHATDGLLEDDLIINQTESLGDSATGNPPVPTSQAPARDSQPETPTTKKRQPGLGQKPYREILNPTSRKP